MPDMRLAKARRSLVDGYQFGHGAWGVMQCTECGGVGHIWCGVVKRAEVDLRSPDRVSDTERIA